MFKPLSKELVFDIDLTDYDPIRTCCTGAKICNRCWQWIPMAIKVIETALREDFGFKHILWVYSGRRGAHCWVSDKKAREMGDERRKAIAGYLELLRGGDKGGKKISIRRPLHPHIEYVPPPLTCDMVNILTHIIDAVLTLSVITLRLTSFPRKIPGNHLRSSQTSSLSFPTQHSTPLYNRNGTLHQAAHRLRNGTISRHWPSLA
jgi:predicted DNA primase small subunit